LQNKLTGSCLFKLIWSIFYYNPLKKLGESQYLKKIAIDFVCDTAKYKYSYNFSWFGRHIIQYSYSL